VPTTAPPVPPIDLGRKVAVATKKASAEEIVLTLTDGTKLQLKPLIFGIERSLEKYNPQGDPIYQVNVALVIQPIVPRRLKRRVR